MIPMKTLTIKGKTYEIVDEMARNSVKTYREEIRQTCATAIMQTVSESPIVVQDSSNNRLLGLKLFGKTTQLTTTGKNLLDDRSFTDAESQGITVSRNDDGSFTVTGVNNGANVSIVRLGEVKMVAGVKYRISGGASPMRLSLRDETTGTVYADDSGETTSYTPSEDITTYLYIRVSDGNAINMRFYPMVRLDSISDSTWEPYTGGMPAPNADFPQTLNHAGDGGYIKVGSTSTNLIDSHSFQLYSNKSIKVSPNGYTISVTGGSNNPYTSSVITLTNLVKTLRGRKVYFACDFLANTLIGTNCGPQINIKRSTHTDYIPLSVSMSKREIEIPDDVVDISIGIYTNNTGSILSAENTVVVEGLRLSLIDDTWTKYSGTTTSISTVDGLPGIPVTSDGNHTDANGQQWVCDEIDFERGVYVKRIGRYVITGNDNETWRVSTLQSVEGATRFDMYIIGPQAGMLRCLSSHYDSTDVPNQKAETCWCNNTGNVAYFEFRIYTSQFTTEDELRAFLVDNPIDVVYVLADPVEIPLSDEVVSAYNILRTIYPSCMIFNDSNVDMEVKYNADTQLYLESCYRPTDNQVETAVNTWLENDDKTRTAVTDWLKSNDSVSVRNVTITEL